jgi:hypothetical protein
MDTYVFSPFSPNALYQKWLNVTFVAGKLSYFSEAAGIGSSASFNGVLGITFDKAEAYAFLTSADGKKVRKMELSTRKVGYDVTRKLHTLV